MTLYRYRAATDEGRIIEASIDVPSMDVLNKTMGSQKLTLLSVTEESLSDSKVRKVGRRSFMRKKELAVFSRQVASLLRAGVPLKQAIDALMEQAKPQHKPFLYAIAQDVQRGDSLSSSFKKYPRTFSQVYTATIAAAEKTGAMEQAFSQLSDSLIWEHKLRKKVKSALQYPTILLSVMVLAMLVLQQVVVPQFRSVFSQLGGNLPLATKVLMGVSYMISHYWWLGLVGLAAGIWMLRKALGNPRWRSRLDCIILKVPVIGSLLRNLFMAQFARMLSLLYESGLPILESLTTLADTIGNRHIADEIANIRSAVSHGQSLGEAINAQHSFSPMVKNMLQVGEQSGEITSSMQMVCEFYDEETNQVIDTIMQWIEPVLTVLLAGFVLFLALAIFMPWWELTGLYQK